MEPSSSALAATEGYGLVHEDGYEKLSGKQCLGQSLASMSAHSPHRKRVLGRSVLGASSPLPSESSHFH